jgi:hypothetical protein
LTLAEQPVARGPEAEREGEIHPKRLPGRPTVVAVRQPDDVIVRLECHLPVNESGAGIDGADETVSQDNARQCRQRGSQQVRHAPGPPVAAPCSRCRAAVSFLARFQVRSSEFGVRSSDFVSVSPANRPITRAPADQPFRRKQQSENVAANIHRPNGPLFGGAERPGRKNNNAVKDALGDAVADSVGFGSAQA